VFIKEKNRIIAGFLVFLLFLSSLVSCEVEVEGSPPAEVLTSARAAKWDNGASSDDDYSISTVSLGSLDSGTSEMRLKTLYMDIDTAQYVGYEIVFCEFDITSSSDAKLTVECLSSINGEEYIGCSSTSFELEAETPKKIEVSCSTGVAIKKGETLSYELRFSSTLPFSEATDGEEPEEDSISFTEWVKIEYVLSGMRFYGVQTVAT